MKTKTMHILVVEDEPGVLRLVKRVLERESHVVETASDGADGFDRAGDPAIDVIVLDILLPKMNGVEVCRRLRRDGVNTPILMLTARDAIDQRVEGLDAGADDYLTKPFAMAELLARVRALGRRHGEIEDDSLSAGDLSVDLVSRRVSRAGRQIELTPKEFALLEFLLRHPGQVLTRSQILDHVWGYDFIPGTNVVDIYVHYLRKKIEDGSGPKLIRTVRGIGYALEAP